MKVDLEVYKNSKRIVRVLFLERYQDRPSRAISELSMATGCPCIVIAYWVGEFTNWPHDIIEYIESLKTFYAYTDIVNKPDNCPI